MAAKKNTPTSGLFRQAEALRVSSLTVIMLTFIPDGHQTEKQSHSFQTEPVKHSSRSDTSKVNPITVLHIICPNVLIDPCKDN